MFLFKEKFRTHEHQFPEGKFQVARLNSSILQYERESIRSLEREFARIAQKTPHALTAVMATGKQDKIRAAEGLLQLASQFKTRTVVEMLHTHQFSKYEEPFSHSAVTTALHKALAAKTEDVDIGVGADVVAATWDRQSRRWSTRQKLERIGRSLTHEEWAQEVEKLRALYVNQKRLAATWEVAMAAVNGSTSVVSARIFVDALPFSEEEFQFFLQHAIQTGLWYSSNARGGLFEMLVQFGKVKRIAVIPGWEFDKSKHIDVKDWMREPTPFLLDRALQMILTTSPYSIHEL